MAARGLIFWWSASVSPRTWRAYSMSVYWNPADVPRKGIRLVRAKRIAEIAPSALRYGIPGTHQRPSNSASVAPFFRSEPGGRAEKRNTAGAREADSGNRAVGASIRHPGNAPEAVKLRQCRPLFHGIGGNPSGFDPVFRCCGKRLWNCVVGLLLLVELSQESDSNR